MKRVRVQYFALLREQRGLAEETVTTGAHTAGALYEALRMSHGFTLAAGRLRVAINDEFAAWDAPIGDGDAVAFLPPVAGG